MSEVNVSDDLETSATGFAALVGVHPKTVSTWVRDGLPHERLKTGVRIAVGLGFRWVRDRDRAEFKKLRGANDQGAKLAKLQAEARLKELDLEERESKLLPAADVEDRWMQIATTVREAVLAVPGVAVQDGLIEPNEEARLDGIVRAALSTLA